MNPWPSCCVTASVSLNLVFIQTPCYHRHVYFLGCSLPAMHILFVITSSWTINIQNVRARHANPTEKDLRLLGLKPTTLLLWLLTTASWFLDLPMVMTQPLCYHCHWARSCPAGGEHRYGSHVWDLSVCNVLTQPEAESNTGRVRTCLCSITLGQRTRPKQTAWWKNVFCHC